MSESWKDWEGRTVDGQFPLKEFLGGSDECAVFLTQYGAIEPQNAVIKLTPAVLGKVESRLTKWKLAATLSHPNLIRIFDVAGCQMDNAGLLYAVMECSDENLSQILPQRPLTPPETQSMIDSVLDALAYLHARGIVHGHVNPANIMAVGEQVKLSCDEILRIGEPSNFTVGAASAYDAPELKEGKISTASDMWSLGMTLVEVLTQKLPSWDATQGDTATIQATMPSPFMEIARECLQPDPELRPSASEIRDRLHPKAPIPQWAAPSKTHEVQDRPARRSFAIPAIATVIVVAAIVMFILFHHRNTRNFASISAQSAIQNQPNKKIEDSGNAAMPQPEATSSSDPATTYAASLPETARKPARAHDPAGPVHKELPHVSQKALSTIRGTVKVGVKVHVDRSGNVTETDLVSPGPSKYFADLALRAARNWTFTTETSGNPAADSEWIIRFEFKSSAVDALPARSVPN